MIWLFHFVNGDTRGGRTTRITLEYISRTVGDPRTTRDLGLAQVQVIF